MSILSDKEITERCVDWNGIAWGEAMIHPFFKESVSRIRTREDIETKSPGRKVLSFGLSSYGYDVRLKAEAKIFSNIHAGIIDPKRLDAKCYVDAVIHHDADGSLYVIIPPNSFMLGVTMEYFNIPRDVLVICVGKSTLARAGAVVHVTPLEPEWEGEVVIEISNGTTMPMKIYMEEGVAQMIFHKAENVCETSYGDRQGKYQGQTGIVIGKV